MSSEAPAPAAAPAAAVAAAAEEDEDEDEDEDDAGETGVGVAEDGITPARGLNASAGGNVAMHLPLFEHALGQREGMSVPADSASAIVV